MTAAGSSSTSSQGVLPPASHTYAEPGVYLVRLAVADDDSKDGSDYVLVSVVEEEIPELPLYDVAVDRAAGASVVNFVSNGRVVTRRPTFPTPHEYALPGNRPSTAVGLEVLTDPVTLAGVPVAAGMLLVTNGAVSPDTIYAVHPTTGQVLAALPLDDDYQSVGGTYHAASDSLFVFSSALNRMVRIDPATGHTVRWTDPQTGASEVGMTSPFAAATAITHGDVTVHPLSGNLVVGADVSTVIYEVDMDGHVVRSLDLATYGLLEAGVTGLAFTHDNQLMLTRSLPGTDTTIVDAGPLFAAKALAARRWSKRWDASVFVAGAEPARDLEPSGPRADRGNAGQFALQNGGFEIVDWNDPLVGWNARGAVTLPQAQRGWRKARTCSARWCSTSCCRTMRPSCDSRSSAGNSSPRSTNCRMRSKSLCWTVHRQLDRIRGPRYGCDRRTAEHSGRRNGLPE